VCEDAQRFPTNAQKKLGCRRKTSPSVASQPL
jgi:hypothetical protein